MIGIFKPQLSTGKRKKFLLLPFAFCLLLETRLTASAQIVPDTIVPDTTLPNNSIVTSNGDITEITGGTEAGGNLFHSFEKFSVPTGGTAFFNNAPKIENIISRVTGNSISNIDGLISANGAANLFLLNPNGIIFGPNASLNIGGSFIGTTANSIKFANDREFSATDRQAPPLLKISVPIGLQYGSNAGEINVQGPGNNLSLDPQTFAVIRDNRPVGLQVQPSQTLALVGGNVTLEGGNLTAEGGRIELGSVNGAGMVRLTPTNPGWTLSYEDIENFQDISLSQAASIDTSGNGGGNIQVQGRRVTLTDGSAILADTLGNSPGGILTLRASEAVEVVGTEANNPFVSGLFTDVAEGATGNGGNLTIETGRLLVADGAQISSGTFSSGNAGALSVTATDVELTGGSPFGPSGLFAPVAPFARGNGGNLTIETGRLRVANGAQIFANTFGLGDAGALTVRATDVELIGTSPGGTPSGLLANVERGATGNGGNLTIETERLRLADGAQVIASTFDAGNAGTLAVRANDVELIGESLNVPSGLFTTVEPESTGNGGNLTIETGRLRVADGAQVAVSTAGSGDAGSLTVRANDVELTGASEQRASGLFANAIFGTGNGGDLMIATDQLIIRDGATINASNFSSRNPNIPPGQGAAGNIQIEAGSILLDNTLPDSQSSITASTASSGGGNIVLQVQDSLIARNGSQISTNSTGLSQAGNITIKADQIQTNLGEITATSNQTGGGDINFTTNLLFLSNQSLISTSVLDSTGGGGNITIDTDFIVAQENSDIRANAVKGPGGNIQISTQDIFLSPDSNITASSEFNIDGTVQITYPELQRNITGVELPENVTDPTGLIATGCPADEGNVFVVTGRGGVPEDPRQTLRGETLWSDLRPLSRSRHIEAQALRPEQGNTDARKNLLMPNSLVEAQGWEIGPDGNVILTASATNVTPKQRWQKITACGDF